MVFSCNPVRQLCCLEHSTISYWPSHSFTTSWCRKKSFNFSFICWALPWHMLRNAMSNEIMFVEGCCKYEIRKPSNHSNPSPKIDKPLFPMSLSLGFLIWLLLVILTKRNVLWPVASISSLEKTVTAIWSDSAEAKGPTRVRSNCWAITR